MVIHLRPKATSTPPRERNVKDDCLVWLNKQDGIWAWRRNVGVMAKLDRFGRTRWIRFGTPGQSDIEGIVAVPLVGSIEEIVGVHLELEVKKPGGKPPTPKQRAYLAAIHMHGGIALSAYSLAELQAKLQQAFERRGWPWPPQGEVRKHQGPPVLSDGPSGPF